MSIHQLNRPREIVAIHEAGHAVIAFLTGYHVICDAVDIDGTTTGGTAATVPLKVDPVLYAQRVRENWIFSEFELRKQRCVIAVAGYAAEKVHAELAGVPFDENDAGLGAHGDLMDVREHWGPGYFYMFGDEILPKLKGPLVWPMVETFAKALMANNGPLPAVTAMSILDESRRKTGAQFKLFLPELVE